MSSKSSTLREFLREQTKPGEEVTVWNTTTPHTSTGHPALHTDATLYKNEGNGNIKEIDHVQIDEPKSK